MLKSIPLNCRRNDQNLSRCYKASVVCVLRANLTYMLEHVQSAEYKVWNMCRKHGNAVCTGENFLNLLACLFDRRVSLQDAKASSIPVPIVRPTWVRACHSAGSKVRAQARLHQWAFGFCSYAYALILASFAGDTERPRTRTF